MSNPHDDRQGDPSATIRSSQLGEHQPGDQITAHRTAADIALSRAAEMLSGIRATRAYADASPEERLELEFYILDLADIRSPSNGAQARP
ncbi:hypothetical protein [Azospirillum sp. B4]|uniref:hypothetical protein n=1 Tax=Azospirillum sp. B4 TaxID=95605 RepID=UPI0011DD8071|nr:hypothetical protein [Azospirillum sp. B4]